MRNPPTVGTQSAWLMCCDVVEILCHAFDPSVSRELRAFKRRQRIVPQLVMVRAVDHVAHPSTLGGLTDWHSEGGVCHGKLTNFIAVWSVEGEGQHEINVNKQTHSRGGRGEWDSTRQHSISVTLWKMYVSSSHTPSYPHRHHHYFAKINGMKYGIWKMNQTKKGTPETSKLFHFSSNAEMRSVRNSFRGRVLRTLSLRARGTLTKLILIFTRREMQRGSEDEEVDEKFILCMCVCVWVLSLL